MRLTYVYIAVAIYLIASYFHVGYVHADEYYQIFQFAAYKIGLTVLQTPWEFNDQMRSTFQVAIIVLVYKLYAIFTTPNPFVIGFIMRLIASSLSLISIIVFIKALLPTILNEKYKHWFVLLTLLTWANVYYNIHYCSENISGKFFLLGFSMLFFEFNSGVVNSTSCNSVGFHFTKFKKTYLKYLLSGIFLGLTFTTRFQTAFLILGLFAWLIFINKIKFKHLIFLGMVTLITIIITNVWIDYWFYGKWTITAWNYFKQNIILNKVNSYGEEPWYYYIYMTASILPFGPFYVISAFLVFFYKPSNVLTWVLLTFIIGHSLIGHKEIRFMVPILSMMPLCIIYAIQIVEDKFKYNVAINWPKSIKYIWYLNCFLLISLLIPPTTELPVWRYIYDSYGKTPSVYYFLTYGGSDVDFYKSKNIESKKIEKISDIQCPKNKKCLLGLTCMQALENNIPFPKKVIYSQCPQWLSKINYGNWIGRTAIYNVYELDNVDTNVK
jgi:GPI mannosyltransferase 3